MAETTGQPARAGLYLPLLWLIGLQLRLTMLAVPPVLPLIHRDLGLSEKAIGLLSALPVLVLGVAAIPGSLGVARLGARRACILGLALVAGAGAARGIGPSVFMLYAMTLAMGVGVALMQPTLPSLVSEWFPGRAGFATAVYGNGLLIGEAVPAAVTIPLVLPLVHGSWAWSFAFWSVPVLAAGVLLALATPHLPRPLPARAYRWWPDWRGAAAAAGLLGGTAGLYFSANAFIPDYLHAIGRPDLVSACLGALNIGQLPASLIILAFARRLTGNRALLTASLLVAVAALAVFVETPALAVAMSGTLGLCCGLQLISSLALPPLLAPAEDVHRLSAGMFAIGYGIAFAVPPLGGALWDATGIPATAFVAALASLGLAAAGVAGLPARPTVRTARAA